jgi:hypothetical protein
MVLLRSFLSFYFATFKCCILNLVYCLTVVRLLYFQVSHSDKEHPEQKGSEEDWGIFPCMPVSYQGKISQEPLPPKKILMSLWSNLAYVHSDWSNQSITDSLKLDFCDWLRPGGSSCASAYCDWTKLDLLQQARRANGCRSSKPHTCHTTWRHPVFPAAFQTWQACCKHRAFALLCSFCLEHICPTSSHPVFLVIIQFCAQISSL